MEFTNGKPHSKKVEGWQCTNCGVIHSEEWEANKCCD